MPSPDAPNDRRVVSRYKCDVAQNGRFVMLTFYTAGGESHEIIIPFDALTDHILMLDGTSKKMLELQNASLGGADRRTIYPVKARRLTKFGGGVSSEGMPILTLGINDSLELDVTIPIETVSELSDWFASLAQTASRNSTPRPN
jgi:hypothetical protein